MSSLPVRQRDAFLGVLATWSRTRLVASVFGAYVTAIVLWGLVYWALALTTVRGLRGNLYFSLVTQATVGYGDVLPSGAGRAVAALQIAVGVTWTAFLPALVVIRLSTPHAATILLSRYVAFDPEAGQFRFKLVNTGRFMGSHLAIQSWLRVPRPSGEGWRTYPVAIRSAVPYETRFAHLRPMKSTAYRTERASFPELPTDVELIRLHPAHFTAEAVLVMDVSIRTPFGTASRTEEFKYTHVVCGRHCDVVSIVDGPEDWSKFDEVLVTSFSEDGKAYCKNCVYRSTCCLASKA